MNMDAAISPKIPSSTCRIQFAAGFGFKDAERIIPYLNELGMSDIYCSPYLMARQGSTHGYDIVDHSMLNPELGTQEHYDAMVGALKARGMGQVLDIVPNHMGTGSENAWWMDVLENGPSSVYAKFFDIDWEPLKGELKNRLLLPILGQQYGNALDSGEIVLSFAHGAFFINYFQHKFPIRPQTYIRVLNHRIDNLKKTLTEDNPHIIELLSIITALGNLPSYTENEQAKVIERAREKEVIKKRLSKLYDESPQARALIEENVLLFNGTKGNPQSFDLLDDLLREQAYRLSFWRVAGEEINYRRFFDINELAALRVEDADVFRETHSLILRLVEEGKVTGMRIDHPDGLYNPIQYFKNLQRECFMRLHPNQSDAYEAILEENPEYKPFYIVAEKILARDERMPEDWPIFSTTGYVFMNAVNGIFIDTAKSKALDDTYRWFIKDKPDFADIAYRSKKLIMQVAMASEINTLGHYLNAISERSRHTRDFTLQSLINAIEDVIATFPVYRTYITSEIITERDRKYIESAVSKAKRINPAISESIFDFLKDVLLMNFPEGMENSEKSLRLDFAMRFQQATGPVMAKGVEDTAFYIYNRLVSLNEVGGSPDRLGIMLDTFHGKNIERAKFWPHALIATSTHDSKRGEDVRARINVLSEMPAQWKDCLIRWSRLNKKKKAAIDGVPSPDRNDEYLLYQTLIGAWPMDGANEGFSNRIKQYMLKAVREAKLNSSWINPNSTYEGALLAFIDSLLVDSRFLDDFLQFQSKVSHHGIFNSLSQALLKITSPGVPDFYQGTELWDLSLVDPDNRRPIDYDFRINSLKMLKNSANPDKINSLISGLMESRHTGSIKQYVIWRALNFRMSNRSIFEQGEYTPMEVEGAKPANVCAFARRASGGSALTIVPRLTASLIKPGNDPIGEGVWGDTRLLTPFDKPGAIYRNVFTEEIIQLSAEGNCGLYVKNALSEFPVALLERL